MAGAPWSHIVKDPARAAVVRTSVNLLALAATVAWPFKPAAAERVLEALGNNAKPSWPSAAEALTLIEEDEESVCRRSCSRSSRRNGSRPTDKVCRVEQWAAPTTAAWAAAPKRGGGFAASKRMRVCSSSFETALRTAHERCRCASSP